MKFHLQQFSPNENFKNSLSPSFSSHLDFEKIPDFVEGGGVGVGVGGAAMNCMTPLGNSSKVKNQDPFVTAYLSGYTGRICLRLNLYFQHIKKLLQSKKGNINITMYKQTTKNVTLGRIEITKNKIILGDVITNTADIFLLQSV